MRRYSHLLTLSILLGLACVTEQPPEVSERMRRIADQLAELGVIVPLEQLDGEVGTLDSARAYFRHETEDTDAIRKFWGEWAIRRAFRLRNETTPDVLRKNTAHQAPESVAGYYDDKRGSAVLLKTDTSGMNIDRLTAHELAHVAQDRQSQTPGAIRRYLERENQDRELAARAVVEGAADLVELGWVLQQRGLDMDSVGPRDVRQNLVGTAVQRTSIAYYELGARYLLRGRKTGRWQPFDLLPEPPASTEQLLHPEKEDRDEPSRIVLSDWSGGEMMSDDVLGELDLYWKLAEARPEERGKMQLVAAGWDGDRYQVYRTPSGWALAWRLLWDRPEDAASFEKHFPVEGTARLARDGSVIDVVDGSTDALREAMVAHLRRAPPPAAAPMEDAETTRAVEARLEKTLAQTPVVVDGAWRYAAHGVHVSVPVPKHYRPSWCGGTRCLVSGLISRLQLFIVTNVLRSSLEELLEKTRADVHAAGGQVSRVRQDQRGATPVYVFDVETPSDDDTAHSRYLITLVCDKQVSIRAHLGSTVSKDADAEMREVLESVTISAGPDCGEASS